MSVISRRDRGFTLPEVMIAMGVGSMLMLSAAQIYPLMRQRGQSLGRHFQLEQLLRQTAFTIEKDLRRAGFCNGGCEGKSVILGNTAGEATFSCVIAIYDLNRNGRWEPPATAESEYFGYRLRQGGLEIQRGAGDCAGSGWEKLLDPAEVNITKFAVTENPDAVSGKLYSVLIEAQWRKNTYIHQQVNIQVAGRSS